MRPITSEEDRQERIAQVRRQLGSPKTSPQKRKDLNKYLNKLMYTKVASETYTQGNGSDCTTTIGGINEKI